MFTNHSAGIPPEQHLPIASNVITDCAAARASAACHAAAHACPPYSNTGGKVYLADIAHIDWFACTVSSSHGDSEELILSGAITCLLRLLNIERSQCVDTGKGWEGYRTKIDLGGYGHLAYGGESQRGSFHVSLNGSGCACVRDWAAVAEWGQRNRAKITRVDLAHDDFEGQTVNVETAKNWWLTGGFDSGGRRPIQKEDGDWSTPGSPSGRSWLVGRRANGKYTRVYEKGKQLGDPSSPWARVEVELRNKARTIPWDVLTSPSAYLAGAFPCLAFLSAVQSKIKTISKAVSISLDTAIRNGRIAVGKLVNVMMRFHAGDAFAVIDDLIRDGTPRRLENFRDFLWPPNPEGAS